MQRAAVESAQRPDLTTIKPDDLLGQAALALSTTPRPFLRWAGSKRALLTSIVRALPKAYRVYHEPFFGAGSLFFLLQPTRAFLSDSCAELVETFAAVRDDPNAVLAYLRQWKPDPDLFYAIRKTRSRGRLKRAAEFIYLNKTCWNGLYRVNSRGEFNVPYGLPKTDAIIDGPNLRACAKALDQPGVHLSTSDFESALERVAAGDLVFLDPPYVTGHNNNGFIDYNERLFSWADQVRLARCARELADKGAHVLVTNAHHDDVINLYKGFTVVTISRTSTLASTASKRGPVTEALLWTQGPEAPSG